MKKISIIIVTYNSEDHIYNCLESIIKFNDIGDSLEIIIVDNNSKNVVSMFNKIETLYPHKIRLISNPKNLGYGQGNNVGIKIALAPYIMIMNPDVRLNAPIFNEIYTTFQKDKNICLIGMKQWYTLNKIGLSFDIDIFILPGIISILLNYFCNKLNIYIPKFMYINGSCFFMDKMKFIEAGLFDENIFMYCEEMDIHRRLSTTNAKNKFKFIRHLNYFHLAGNRAVSYRSYEKQIDSELYCASKFNYPQHKLIAKRIAITKFYLLINILLRRKHNIDSLKNILKYLNKIKKNG